MSDTFSEDAYHDLRELQVVLQELTETEGWQALVREARKTIDERKRQVLGGYLTDAQEYLMVTWHIKGAEDVLDLPAAITRRLDEYRKLLAEQTAPVE